MIIYFHLSKNKDKKREERPPEPWITNWTKEQLVERMRGEMKDHTVSEQNILVTILPLSLRLKKTQRIQQENNRPENPKNKTQSKKKKVILQDSSLEQTQSYHGSEIGTQELDEFLRENIEKSAAHGMVFFVNNMYSIMFRIPDVNLGSNDPFSQRHTEQSSVNKPAESVLSLFEESASEPAEENVMVMREETPSEVLAIVSIQVCLPLSQTTTTPETENEPTPLLQIEGTTKSTPESPHNLKKPHPRFPQLYIKCKFIKVKSMFGYHPNPVPEDAEALMMMARTASYVPKADSLSNNAGGGINIRRRDAKNSRNSKAARTIRGFGGKIANSGMKAESKNPQIQKESGGESSGKFETHVRINQNTAEMKEKCYIWGTRLKKYADGRTNEFDNVCTLIAQDKYILTRMHLASLKAESHIEAEIVSAMCLIIN
ncbi:hypothetical protein Ahy_A08g038801 [Arachis hypogaea]|uniref:Uncharacterized protein n=1 Tax=Arachis hypogaea TaxID=3818 RepID=A0A445BUQ3_ARAHY|nr:hypothetical protein Ahy_A08g038801 [Arachis hypogaea]